MKAKTQSIKCTLLVSSYYPPVVGGTSTVVGTLFSAFEPDTFKVVAETPESIGIPAVTQANKDDCSVKRYGAPAFLRRLPFGSKIAGIARYAIIPSITRAIVSTAEQFNAELIIGVHPSWPFLIAAYQAHLRTGIPFATYFMDIITDPGPENSVRNFFQRRYEKRIMDVAFRHFVLSTPLADNLKKRFNIEAVVVPHAVPSGHQVSNELPDCLKFRKTKNILVHTGVVEGLQESGLLRIAKVLEKHPELETGLILATPSSAENLRRRGFDLPCVDIVFLSDDEVAALQANADVLIAVLPFDENDRHAATAFPTKVMEYLAAERPVLAFASKNSYFASHVNKHGYALVVSDTSDEAILNGLQKLLSDQVLRNELIAKARRTANETHSLSNVASTFAKACNLFRGHV